MVEEGLVFVGLMEDSVEGSVEGLEDVLLEAEVKGWLLGVSEEEDRDFSTSEDVGRVDDCLGCSLGVAE